MAAWTPDAVDRHCAPAGAWWSWALPAAGAVHAATSPSGGGFLPLHALSLPCPPSPGCRRRPEAEGHYLFVNKNLIEMLALLVLATTHSGRWLGLDGLLQYLNPLATARRSR